MILLYASEDEYDISEVTGSEFSVFTNPDELKKKLGDVKYITISYDPYGLELELIIQ